MAKTLYDFVREETDAAKEVLEAALKLNLWVRRAGACGWDVRLQVSADGVLMLEVGRSNWAVPEEDL